jgi:diaminobutyrate-2-oxoglutarate transaminase
VLNTPLAIMLYDRSLDSWSAGAHIGTFRGNQLAFAGGIAAIEVMQRENVLLNVRSRAAELRQRLEDIGHRSRWVAEVRGAGLLLGMELAHPEGETQTTDLARALQSAALRNGLILEVGGRGDATLRFLPPLNVTKGDIDTAMLLLERAFAQVDSEFKPAAGAQQ